MKFKKTQILINLTLLTTPCLFAILILCPKNLATLVTQEISQTRSTRHPQELSELNNPEILQVSNQVAKSSQVVSVKHFGAVGNGLADDTKAIQAAINATSKAGGGSVFFPHGTYKVSINRYKLHAVTIRNKVKLQGSGHKESIIKLAAKQGNYDSILAGEKPDSNLSDFAMYDLAIDGNSTQNTVLAESDITAKTMRYSVRIYVGSRINIERCRFLNQNNANVITLNGNFAPFQVSVTDVAIKNNIFELIGGGKVDYDHSTIYTHGKHIEITNNYFSSRNGAGTNVARTAIEIHGDEHIVKDNVITGFTNGINVTGYASSSNNQIVTNNVIKEAYSGITIWSYFSYGNTTNPALSNCTIANNKISLNIDDWRRLWGNAPSAGITLEANSDAPIKNLNIVNNEIYFTKFSGRGRVTDNLANGIQMWRNAAPNVVSENLRISGNQIRNSLAAGIYIFMPLKESEISQNTILNPGKSNGKFDDGYRAAMIVAGNFENLKINQNLLADNQKVNTVKGGIISFANCQAKCEASGNKLQVRSGADYPVFRSASEKNNNFKVLD